MGDAEVSTVQLKPGMSRLRALALSLVPPALCRRGAGSVLGASCLGVLALALAVMLILLAIMAVSAAHAAGAGPWRLAGAVVPAAVGLALTGIILWRVQYHLVEPLSHLREWASRMQGGDLSARIPVAGDREFARLAADVNDLGVALQTLSRDLDAQVHKQTEQLAQKTRTLQILYDVAARINISRDLDDLLSRFLHTLREVMDAQAASVRLLADNGQMRLVASVGLDSEVVRGDELLPLQRCLCGQSIAEGELLCQDDISKCGEIIGRPMLKHPQGLEMIAVPLQYQGRTLGVYNLFVEKQGLVGREDVKSLLTSIGRHLGMAIEKARLDEQAKRLFIMRERTTMAHELHDSLAQTVAGVRFQMKMLEETMEEGRPEEARQELQQIEESLEEAHVEIRELIAHFRAPADQGGLITALEGTVARFRKETGIVVFFQKECNRTILPASYEIQVLRVVQEALTNIRKHAHAHAVRIMLRCDAADHFRVLVEDDGKGMGEQVVRGHPGEHIGLAIMRERARRIAGRLTIESDPGEGTRVELTFRCREAQAVDPAAAG